MKGKRSCIVQRQPIVVAFQHIPKTAGQSVHSAFNARHRHHFPMRNKGRREEINRADFSFCIVRNPIDRAVSWFYWLRGLNKQPRVKRAEQNAGLNVWARNTDVNSFWEQIDIAWLHRYTRLVWAQWEYIGFSPDDLNPKLSIFRYEDLATEWETIQTRCGKEMSLPKKNISKRQSWRLELGEKAQERIRKIYKEDFRVLGYE